ncbi:hypothetical protein R1sor_026954 [Riccia sorocarpa]|uniref:FCP1 homology domain-containing protein n=1 Tax=Riccia sorocarpa TaxID=122646 RepID=A0ABD3GGJ8_9MARC
MYDICGTVYAVCWIVPRPGMAGFLRRYQEWFNVILWTSRTERTLAIIVRACNKRDLFPGDFAKELEPDVVYRLPTVREHHRDGFLRFESIRVMYNHNIHEFKDVLILDDLVQKNSSNHPYQAVHPRSFDPMKTAKKDDNYLHSVLLTVLNKFRFHRQDVMSFVEANWDATQAQEPFSSLAVHW